MSSGAIEDLAELLNEHAGSVNPKLKQLVGQVRTAALQIYYLLLSTLNCHCTACAICPQCISGKLDLWKEAAGANRVSYPRLVDVDWSMHVKRSSSQVRNMLVPTVVLSLQIENQADSVNVLPDTSIVPVECNYAALGTILEGLNKIKEQLNTMGK